MLMCHHRVLYLGTGSRRGYVTHVHRYHLDGWQRQTSDLVDKQHCWRCARAQCIITVDTSGTACVAIRLLLINSLYS
jgi:hypothetical protein